MTLRPSSMAALAALMLLIGILLGYFVPRHFEQKAATLKPEGGALVSTVTVTVYAPLQGLNKKEAGDAGLITKKTEKDPDKGVLAAGTIKDDSGTQNVSAVVNTDTGVTQLEVTRSFAEHMSAHELGVGITAGTLGWGEEMTYRHTFARVWQFYPDVRLTGWRWEAGTRRDAGKRYDFMASAMMNFRWQGGRR